MLLLLLLGGGSGGSGNVALSGGGLGCNVLGIMRRVAVCLGTGGGQGFHILGFLGLGVNVQDVRVFGVDGDLAIGDNDGF